MNRIPPNRHADTTPNRRENAFNPPRETTTCAPAARRTSPLANVAIANSTNTAKYARKLSPSDRTAAAINSSPAIAFRYPKSRAVFAVSSFSTARKNTICTVAARNVPEMYR